MDATQFNVALTPAFPPNLALGGIDSSPEPITTFSNLAAASISTNTNNDTNNTTTNTQAVPTPTTSISFGGKTARSRYLCCSDRSTVSIWDLKKSARVRNWAVNQPCIQSCLDPSDTLVCALLGRSDDQEATATSARGRKSAMTFVELFHLKKGYKVGTLEASSSGSSSNGGEIGISSCFGFPNENSGTCVVGTQTGSLLQWDLGSISSTSKSNNPIALEPQRIWTERHIGSISQVEFSPLNPSLLASCGSDGRVAFHDLTSGGGSTIQDLSVWDHLVPPAQPVSSSVLTNGLTTVAFYQDGYQWAVGTENGLCLLYDLRMNRGDPIQTLSLTNGTTRGRNVSVTKICFCPDFESLSTRAKTPRTGKRSRKDGVAASSNGMVNNDTLPEALASSVTRTGDPSSVRRDNGVTDQRISSTNQSTMVLPQEESINEFIGNTSSSVVRDLFDQRQERSRQQQQLQEEENMQLGHQQEMANLVHSPPVQKQSLDQQLESNIDRNTDIPSNTTTFTTTQSSPSTMTSPLPISPPQASKSKPSSLQTMQDSFSANITITDSKEENVTNQDNYLDSEMNTSLQVEETIKSMDRFYDRIQKSNSQQEQASSAVGESNDGNTHIEFGRENIPTTSCEAHVFPSSQKEHMTVNDYAHIEAKFTKVSNLALNLYNTYTSHLNSCMRRMMFKKLSKTLLTLYVTTWKNQFKTFIPTVCVNFNASQKKLWHYWKSKDMIRGKFWRRIVN